MMHRRRPMRLLLREHGKRGGIETVNIHLIREFTELVERVVWIVPNARMKFFQRILPPSDRLIYERPNDRRPPRMSDIVRKLTPAVVRKKLRPARAAFHDARNALRDAAWPQKTSPTQMAFEYMRQRLSDFWLRRLVRRHHITHCFWNWTFCRDVPRINVPMGVMLMDVRWKRFPETFPHTDIVAADHKFQQWLRKADVVFPVSETTASDIERFYPWHSGPIRVVPHGAQNNGHGQTVDPPSRTTRCRCMFFYPGAANGHKNHITLFRASAELFRKGIDFEVVLTGFGTQYFDPNYPNNGCSASGDAALEAARTFLRNNDQLFQGRIKALGYLDPAEINKLYNDCTAVVLPSLFEGFGLPLLEAQEHGATVICSDIPAHREQLRRYQCDDHVTAVPPTDGSALAREMERIVTKSTAGIGQKQAPPGALKQWTWRDAAEAYLDSLAAITPGGHGS
jgi:glycosyltransferase involved in cell wall biosynthesis